MIVIGQKDDYDWFERELELVGENLIVIGLNDWSDCDSAE